MRKLALLFAIVLVVAACGDVDQAERDEARAATPPATTAAPVDEHADDDHVADAEDHADDDAVAEDHEVEENHAVADDHADEDPGDDHADETAIDADRTVDVVLTEFAFEPDSFQVAAGETVEFLVTNTGFVEHEFRLSNEHRIEEHLAAGHEDHDDDAAEMHHEEGGDFILLLDPGETGSITVTFGDDTALYTEVACLIPGHYEAGMHTALTYSA